VAPNRPPPPPPPSCADCCGVFAAPGLEKEKLGVLEPPKSPPAGAAEVVAGLEAPVEVPKLNDMAAVLSSD